MRLCLSLGALFLTASIACADPLDDLIKQLQDKKDPEVRMAAAKQIAEMGPEAKPALPALVGALKDDNLYVRRFALQAIGEVGPEAKSVVADVMNVMKKEGKKEVLQAAAATLGKIKDKSAVKPLADLVKDSKKDDAVRQKAAEALGAFGA